MDDVELVPIEVVLAESREQHIIPLEVTPGATVMDAIRASGLTPPSLGDRVGIFGRPCRLNQTLQSGDRVEIYRSLLADPKTIRRRRAAKFAP